MRVAILHNAVAPDASESDRDVLVQVAAVEQALTRLGHEHVRIAATLDLRALHADLLKLAPDIVFNLVESLNDSDWLMFLVTGLLDSMAIPYTGAPTEALVLSTHKILAKQWLSRAGLPTPAWIGGSSRQGAADTSTCPATELEFGAGRCFMLKPISQDSSLGMEDDCVVKVTSRTELDSLLAAHTQRLGCPCFAEEYIVGREFNVSLLAAKGVLEVLPPAEIDFNTFPVGKPRIVGYRAKWDADSFEYQHTPRTFDFSSSDQLLLAELAAAARRCWDLFQLAGYGRIDFRIDEQGHPWILEINANPCLSPDAGFAAALARATISFDEAIARILYVPYTSNP